MPCRKCNGPTFGTLCAVCAGEQPPEPKTQNTMSDHKEEEKPTVFLDFADQHPDVPSLSASGVEIGKDTCPACGGSLIWNHGLMGGGVGTYALCDSCDFMAKEQDRVDVNPNEDLDSKNDPIVGYEEDARWSTVRCPFCQTALAPSTHTYPAAFVPGHHLFKTRDQVNLFIRDPDKCTNTSFTICRKCGARGPLADTEGEAMKKWIARCQDG